MKQVFIKLLAFFSQGILRKYRPRVVGITGSIGKTSVKEASYAVVSAKFRARTNIKNYNNEFGLPFTIIGVESPRRNPFKWLWVFAKALGLYLLPLNYPEVLVLEMGIDRPGDMDELLDIVSPDIAVLTTIGVSHLQYFGTQENILREKSKIFSRMTNENFAILNYDDFRVEGLRKTLNPHTISYGMSQNADLKIARYRATYSEERQSFGTECELEYHHEKITVFLKDVLGVPAVSAAAAGAAVGVALGMNLSEIKKGLQNFRSEPGRMRVLAGINNSLIIDDTYNAAPLSTNAALQELSQFKAEKFKVQKRIAILGDMLELGDLSNSAHQEIGDAARRSADIFIGVGEQIKEARPDFWFPKSADAIAKARELAQEGTLFLVKGSQGARMEKVSYALLRDKKIAKNLLCRQDDYWLKI